MRKIIILIIFFIIIAIGVVLAGLYYWNLREGCADGRGTNYYFEKGELLKNQDIASFDASKAEIIAQSTQSCSVFTRRVKESGHWQNVKNYDQFKAYLDKYNTNCSDCLFVQSFGWPTSGEVTKYSTNEGI